MKYFAQVTQLLSKRNAAQIEASWFPNSLQMRWLTLGVTGVSPGSVSAVEWICGSHVPPCSSQSLEFQEGAGEISVH